jgi:hypothetical protein
MHDWTLTTATFDWESGNGQLGLISPDGPCAIIVTCVQAIHIPRKSPWGASVSINAVYGPTLQEDGLMRLSIEMQSGDTIEFVAASFSSPISN